MVGIRFLDEVDTSPQTEEGAFEAHLKIIIWGVLYLERKTFIQNIGDRLENVHVD
jgi:hypothetical protein